MVTAKTKRVLVGTRLPLALYRQLRTEAVRRGMTIQAMIERAVRQYLSPKGR